MSLNRNNVTWQSQDGKWNRGFYAYYQTGEDFEWDVEYIDEFNWVSLGHSTLEKADESWKGANPGHTWVIPYDPADSTSIKDIEHYNDLAKKFLDSSKVRR